jgi:hypothetical protein
MCAGGERLTAVNCADGHDDGCVTDLEVADAMLHRDRQDIVLISGLLSTLGQYLECAGVLGVVEGDDVGPVVRAAHGPDEKRDATDRRARDQAKRLVDTER